MLNDFNSKDYISKFYFTKFDYARTSVYRQKISANLHLQELKIEIINPNNKIVDAFGYSLKSQIKNILPLVRWEKFEKTRDVSGWDLKNSGYRDGWGYDFLCLNESGKPLIQNHLDVFFENKDKPAYEKLLDWVINEYSNRKELKDYKLFW